MWQSQFYLLSCLCTVGCSSLALYLQASRSLTMLVSPEHALHLSTPFGQLWFRLFFGVVIAAGLGSYFVSLDPKHERSGKLAAAVGKTVATALFAQAYLAGHVTALTMFLMCFDLLLAAISSLDLLYFRGPSQVQTRKKK